MSRIDEEFKAKWIEALESGRYAQAQGALRHGDAYCCLGVACDIAGVGEWREDEVGFRFTYLGASVVAFLSPAIVSRVMKAETFLGFSDLISMNDQGKTFAEIAQYIREKY